MRLPVQFTGCRRKASPFRGGDIRRQLAVGLQYLLFIRLSYTSDPETMAEWLKKCGIRTVAMQSTGVGQNSGAHREPAARVFAPGVQVDRFFPSTKLCSECGHKNDDLSLSDRECPGCRTPPPAGLERCQKRESGRSEDRRRGTPRDGKRLRTASQSGGSQHCGLKQENNPPPSGGGVSRRLRRGPA